MKNFLLRLKNPKFILGVLGILFGILTNICHLSISFPNWQLYANIISVLLTGVGVYSTFGITSAQSIETSVEELAEGVVDAVKTDSQPAQAIPAVKADSAPAVATPVADATTTVTAPAIPTQTVEADKAQG